METPKKDNTEPETESYFEFDLDKTTELETITQPIFEPNSPADEGHKLTFTEKEERFIQVRVEINRRTMLLETDAVSVTDDMTELIDTPALINQKGIYIPTRRSIWSYLVVSWKQSSIGILVLIAIWLLATIVPTTFFEVESGSRENWIIILIAIGIMILTLVVLFLVELKPFMKWRNWTLEVTDSEVIISQKESVIGRVNEFNLALERSSVKVVKVERKWYLFFLDMWTVTFDTPTEEDREFHGLLYIKHGKQLQELFARTTS